MSTWIYHPKLKRRVRVNFGNKTVRPKHFREFVERILEHFDKIIDKFEVEEARKIGGVGNWGTAKEYLQIMESNGLLKPVSTKPRLAYIVSCTPREELLALLESVGSRIATRKYNRFMKIVERSKVFLRSKPIVKLRENRPILRFALKVVDRRISKWDSSRRRIYQ